MLAAAYSRRERKRAYANWSLTPQQQHQRELLLIAKQRQEEAKNEAAQRNQRLAERFLSGEQADEKPSRSSDDPFRAFLNEQYAAGDYTQT